MKLAFLVVLLILSAALAASLYVGEPLYMLAFVLVGVAIAVYLALMARLFTMRPSMWSFLMLWTVALLGLSLGEGWARSHSAQGHIGLLPTVTMAFHDWQHRYDNVDAQASSQLGASGTHLGHASIIDNPEVRTNLTALVVAELCNEADLLKVERLAYANAVIPGDINSVGSHGWAEADLKTVYGRVALLDKIHQQRIKNFETGTTLGRTMLASENGPFSSEARQDFSAEQQSFAGVAEMTRMNAADNLRESQDLLTLALSVEKRGSPSVQQRADWNRIQSALANSSHPDLEPMIRSLPRLTQDASTHLGYLLGDPFAPEPFHSAVYQHCASSIPAKPSSDQYEALVQEISARWDSKDWLLKGRAQQSARSP